MKTSTNENRGSRAANSGDMPGYVDADALLEIVFPNPESRPTLPWLRTQREKGNIPFVKLGRLVFFNPTAVLAAFERRQNGAN